MTPIRRRISCCVVVPIVIIMFTCLIGCASREDRENPAITEASAALAKAEQAMKAAGVSIDFKSLGGLEVLADLRRVLPEPANLSPPEKQTLMETAIEAFYETLDALEETATPVPFTEHSGEFEAAFEISETDSMLTHFHLAYLYTLAAVSRLARTGSDLYFIEFSHAEDAGVYKFKLTPKGEALVEAIDLKQDPVGVIKIFNEEQRQAMIDALGLLTGAEVLILRNPQAGIKAQKPQIDRNRCRSNAFVHLQKSIEIGETLPLEIKDALDGFDKAISAKFSKEMLEDVKEFGFEIRTVPERFERLLRP